MNRRIIKALVLSGMLLLCLSLSGCYIPPDDLSGNVSNLGVGSNNLPFDPVSYTDAPTATASPTAVQAGAFDTPEPMNGVPNVSWPGDNTGVVQSNQPGVNVTNNPGVTTTRPIIGVTTANPGTNRPASTNTPAPSSLKKGDSGDSVKALQRRLKELGYYTGSVDGDFGENTEKAVKAFQQNNGLTVDGKAGTKTMTKLNSSSAVKASTATATPKRTATPTPKRTATPKPTATKTPKPTSTPNLSKDIYLRVGSSGSDVKRLQERLISLGWLTGTAGNSYGGAVEAAVIAFQKKTSGLYDDGVAGPETLKAIYSSNAAKSSSPVASVGVKLQQGSEGDAVRALQKRLKTLGYLKESADGSYGEKTKAAVLAFQTNNGLKATGVAGTDTLDAIYSQDALKAGQGSSDNNTSDTLRVGDEGSSVTSLQKKLHELGYYDGKINGIYSSLVSEAVKAFQSNNGLKADGVAGPDTLKKLYSSSAKSADSTTVTFKKLQRGDSGSDVVEMQDALKGLGYLAEITGIYDEATYWAVKSFQERNGLTSDGIAGTETLTKLYSSSAIAAY